MVGDKRCAAGLSQGGIWYVEFENAIEVTRLARAGDRAGY
jgi:hypothetical protein